MSVISVIVDERVSCGCKDELISQMQMKIKLIAYAKRGCLRLQLSLD